MQQGEDFWDKNGVKASQYIDLYNMKVKQEALYLKQAPKDGISSDLQAPHVLLLL